MVYVLCGQDCFIWHLNVLLMFGLVLSIVVLHTVFSFEELALWLQQVDFYS